MKSQAGGLTVAAFVALLVGAAVGFAVFSRKVGNKKIRGGKFSKAYEKLKQGTLAPKESDSGWF